MQPEEVITQLGGVATRAELLTHVTEGALRRALAGQRVVRHSRGRYALPFVPTIGERVSLEDVAQTARRAAHQMSGTAVLQSAAARWGWRMKWYPTRPQVAVPRGRAVPASVRRRIDVRYRDVPAGDRDDGWVTDRVRTALDCAGQLPQDEALAIVDSALREGMVTQDELLLAAAGLPNLYRSRAESVIGMASSEAANPFESVLRWIVSDIPGLQVRPQVEIHDDEGKVGTVDLADEELRLVLEADSFEWHGQLDGLEKDCYRYDRFIAQGWLVLRFTWEMVMYRPEWVRAVVIRTMEQCDLRVRRPGPGRRPGEP